MGTRLDQDAQGQTMKAGKAIALVFAVAAAAVLAAFVWFIWMMSQVGH